jgi:hypothetical protein
VQRAYRARLKASGKALKLVDVDFDPAERHASLAKQRDDLHKALADLELRQKEVARLEVRVAYLEAQVRELEPKAKEAIRLRQLLQVRRQKTKLEREAYK